MHYDFDEDLDAYVCTRNLDEDEFLNVVEVPLEELVREILEGRIADGKTQAAILKAEAEQRAAILKADGEAQAIRTVQQALADSLGMLNEKAPNEQVIKLKSIQAMEKVADGKATKIIIPSEMQGLVGMAKGLVESVKE